MCSKNIKAMSKRNHGAVFFSTLLLVFLFSSLLLSLTADYRASVRDYQNIRSYYLAQTIKELFLWEYYQGVEFTENPLVYNCGMLKFEVREQLEFSVRVGDYFYEFKEPLRDTEFENN